MVTATETKTAWNLDETLVVNSEAIWVTIGLIVGGLAGLGVRDRLEKAVRWFFLAWAPVVGAITLFVARSGASLELNGLHFGFMLVAYATLGVVASFLVVVIVAYRFRPTQQPISNKSQTSKEPDVDQAFSLLEETQD